MALFLEFLSQQWMPVGALLAVIVMLILHEGRKSGPSLSPQQAINVVNSEDGVFIDLRDAAEFKKGHIVNASNIPSAKLPARLVELEKFKDKPIIVVCAMGMTSKRTASQMLKAGFEKVVTLKGGINAWQGANLPTTK